MTIAGGRHGIALAALGDPGDAFAAGVGNVDVAVPVEGGPVGAFEFSEQPGLAVVIDPEEPSGPAVHEIEIAGGGDRGALG